MNNVTVVTVHHVRYIDVAIFIHYFSLNKPCYIMRPCPASSLLLIMLTFFACNSGQKSATPTLPADNRPKAQLSFLKRVKGLIDSAYYFDQNAALKDEHTAAFTKYATDSLDKITGWEMIVTGINNNSYASNSVSRELFEVKPNSVYNLELVAPGKYDPTVDTIDIMDRADLIATVDKEPDNDGAKKLLEVIKKLNKGDTVIVNGAITHVDADKNVNFAVFHKMSGYHSYDLLLTDIKKKGIR